MTERHLGWEAQKRGGLIHSWYISPAGHQTTTVSPVSFPFFLPASCCQLPKDICSHPLRNEKVLMHDFRICQNTQYLQVFGDAANLTMGKRNEEPKSSCLEKGYSCSLYTAGGSSLAFSHLSLPLSLHKISSVFSNPEYLTLANIPVT